MTFIRLRSAAKAGMLLLLAFSLGAVTLPVSAQPDSSRLTSFNIPAQNLDNALTAFAQQSGQELLYSPATAAGKTGNAVEGSMTRTEAMAALLEGTGLEYELHPSGSMLIGDEAALQTYRQQLDSPDASVAGQNTIGQRRPGIEEIIVTGQKREERIQDVPIAISAFSPEDLEAQKIEGGFDLLKGVPNVTFSKTNFSGYNFQIRGIGTQAISATTDPAVAVSFNNTTLIVNRLFEQEYLDVERVEVLRGPQGTLFGRNATSGVINVISNKPELGVWDGMFDIEVGNYNTRRLRGMFNMPIGDTLALRGAYASTIRDGFGYNEASEVEGVDVSPDVDNRDLWTGRLTLGWQPHDRLRANLLWERFEEDDQRVRTSKQLCHRDPTPTEVNGFSTGSLPHDQQAMLSQGCVGGSLYSDEAFGTVNGHSLPYVTGLAISTDFGWFFSHERGIGANPYYPSHSEGGFGLEPPSNAPCERAAEQSYIYPFDVCNADPYGGRMQSRDLRTIYSEIEPEYRATADIYELSLDFEVSDSLLLSSQTVYTEDEYWASQDYNRFTTLPFWNDAREACGVSDVVVSGKTRLDCTDDPDTGRGTWLPLKDEDGDGTIDLANQPLKPGQTVDGDGWVRNEEGRRVGWFSYFFPGEFCDPQLGCSNKLVVQDLSRAESKQFNQEFRLVSSFAGPVNFSIGANYTKFETFNDYFVFSNAFTALLHTGVFNTPMPGADPAGNHAKGQFIDRDNNRCLPYEVNPDRRMCRYIDPNPLESINGEGHNYFRSANPYELTSTALFGEFYWNVTDTVKLTVGARMTWDQKVFTPIPSQLLLADYRDLHIVGEGDPPPEGSRCAQAAQANCAFTGTATDGRGSPASPDIIQNWREPTGRVVLDWSPEFGLSWLDESMFYASFSHGYKGGGANPPTVAPPSGNVLARASGAAAPRTFEPEFINAYEVGTKNTLFGGGLVLNASAFYYDYTDYQVSKIVDRSAANENFDAEVWGLELESIFAPTVNTQFNAAIGYLRTEVANGETSIDLMDRAAGGERSFTTPDGTTWNGYSVVKPWVVAASNCLVPTQIVMGVAEEWNQGNGFTDILALCPVGGVQGGTIGTTQGTGEPSGRFVPYVDENGKFWTIEDDGGFGPCDPSDQDNCSTRTYYPFTDAPNVASGFAKDLGGNELPSAPRFTVALGAQHSFDLTRDWRATARMDYYWQDQSYARVYNFEPYDRLKSWSNTNLSFWVNNANTGITVEAYVKNLFDETPITGSFLNSDDSGLTTNVFTLDPRLIGVSIRKEF